MGSNATGTPAGSLEVRARAKSRAYNSPYEQELFLARGGTVEQWYACAATPAVTTAEDDARALLARLIRLMPPGLDAEEQADYIATAQRRVRL